MPLMKPWLGQGYRLKVKNPEEVQETIFDIINKSNEAVLKSLEKLQVEISKKLELLDVLQRKNIFLQFFHSRETPGEDFPKQDKFARTQIKAFLEDIDGR